MRNRIVNLGVEFVPVIYNTRKKEFLKYEVLRGKAVNDLGFLKSV